MEYIFSILMIMNLRTRDGPGLPSPAVDVLLPGLDGVSRSRVTEGCQIPVKGGIGNKESDWLSLSPSHIPDKK